MKKNISTFSDKKIALICDWIGDWWGAEIVLEQMMDLFPHADIYSSVFWQDQNTLFTHRSVYTSFIQNIPLLNKKHKFSSILRPQAFESFDLSAYDIVISSSSAESKWVITKPQTLHICYCHTPTRYFWSHYHEYTHMLEFWWFNPLIKILMPRIIHKLRAWDYVAAQRPDVMIANSYNTQNRIQKYYRRKSQVIHPCLHTKNIPYSEEKSDYYFYAWRVIPYKKFDLIVEAFNQNGLPLKIVANTKNALSEKLKAKSAANIEWIYETDNKKINQLHAHAKAFLFPPEEDFWLVPIAAMASGTPVIAYWKWGALETVTKDTGLFFQEQSCESINAAIARFETLSFDAKKIREHALSFDISQFQTSLLQCIQKNIA